MVPRTKNHYLILIFCFGLIFSLLFGGTTYAQGEGGGESDPVGARLENDDRQTETEAQHLTELQRQDEQACEAEAGGGGSPLGGGGNPIGGGGALGDDTGFALGDEDTTRAVLAEAGWTVNNQADCGGLTFTQYAQANGGQRCTSVAGLPQHTIDRLDSLRDQVGANSGLFVLTGGTEAGHATHGAGNNIADLGLNNPSLNQYITSNADAVTTNRRGERVYSLGGDQYTRESDHWHVNFGGSATQSAGQALAPTSKAGWAGIWQQVQLALRPVVEAASFGHLLDFGDSLINLNTTSNDQLNQMIAGLDELSLNQLFTGSGGSAINGILNRLDFNTLNQTVGRLNANSFNNVMALVTNDTFSNISPLLIEDSFNEILGGLNRNTLNRMIGNFTDGNLSTIFSTIGGDEISDILGGLTGGTANDLLGRLGQGAINNIFGGLGDFQIDNLIDGLGPESLNRVFTTLGGSTLNGVLEGLGGSTMESILPLLGNSGLTNMFSNGLPDVLNTALQGVSPEILGPVLNSLPSGVLNAVSGIPAISAVLGNVPGLGAATGLLGGGLYVPVVEQKGQLMTHTESIDTTTQEVRDLSIQICTYLKQIARIQASFETSRAEDAAVSRVARTELDKYLLAVTDLIKKGYTDNAGNQGGPLFVVNTRLYWQESALEGENLARLAIKASNNPDKDEILNSLSNNDLSIEPSITSEQIQLLQQRPSAKNGNQGVARAADNIPILSSLIIKPFKKAVAFVSGGRLMAKSDDPDSTATNESAEKYWDAWKQLIEPRNNRFGMYLIAQDLVNQKRQEAVEIAKHETLAAQDFLPVRECGEWIEIQGQPKVCKVWATKTPGTIIEESGASALNSPLGWYLNADSKGEVVKGDEPNAGNLTDFLNPDTGSGGAPGPGQVEPDEIPEEIQTLRSDAGPQGSGSGTEDSENNSNETGSNDLGGMDWNNLISLVDGLFSQDEPNQADNDLLQRIIDFLSGIANNQDPMVNFKKKDRSDNEILLYWFAPNAKTCVSNIDWLNDKEEIIRAKGVSLTQKGSVRLAPPSTGATYKITCTNDKGSVEKTVTIPATTQ